MNSENKFTNKQMLCKQLNVNINLLEKLYFIYKAGKYDSFKIDLNF